MGNLCFTNNFLPPRRIGKKILLRNREKIVLEQVGLGVELFSITNSLPMPSTPIPLSKKFDFDRAGIEIDLEDSPLHFSWIGIPDSNFSSDWICLHSQTKERERERERDYRGFLHITTEEAGGLSISTSTNVYTIDETSIRQRSHNSPPFLIGLGIQSKYSISYTVLPQEWILYSLGRLLRLWENY